MSSISQMKEQKTEPNRFTNHYLCTKDGTTWQDESPYTNNDRCPTCDTECTPVESTDI